MNSRTFARIATLALTLVFALGGICMASSTPAPAKPAVLLVSFGSSMPEGQAAITATLESVRQAFPKAEVRLAYTSRIIMRKLAKEGQLIDDPLVALAKLHADGFTHVAILSTHVIPGEEYEDLASVVRCFDQMGRDEGKSGFRGIALSRPLLWSDEDFDRLAAALNRTYGKRIQDGAVVFMGHGTPHPANGAYSRLQTVLNRISPRYLVGTVEGTPSFEDMTERLKALGVRRVTLVPAMLVAGDHAHNDMAGPEEDSWKSQLTKMGFRVDTVLQGFGQNPEIRALLVEHLKTAAKDVF